MQFTKCDVPIGITLTKLRPERVKLSEQVHPRTQRFASAFYASSAEGGRLYFRQLDRKVFDDLTVGKLIAMPSEGDGVIKVSDIRALVEASSAFPLAFAPRELRFYRAEHLNQNGSCAGGSSGDCPYGETDFFLDGGVFDNNPLHLSIKLREFASKADSSSQVAQRSPMLGGKRPGVAEPAIVYIDPDETRLPVEQFEYRTPDPLDTRGLSALGQLAKGFLPAAREYELQALARMMPDSVRNWIRTTDRSQPIFGNYLAAFGAFLGRPFREFDFYAGVYDGLHFMARSYACADHVVSDYPPGELYDQGMALGPNGASVATSRVDCAVTTVDNWLNSLNFSEPARGLMQRFLTSEHEHRPINGTELARRSDSKATSIADTNAVNTSAVYTRLFYAQQSVMGFDDDVNCKDKQPIDKILCKGGFHAVIDSLNADVSVKTILAERSRAAACMEPLIENETQYRIWASCAVEPRFLEFVSHPRSFLVKTTQRFLHQLWRVENELARQGKPNNEAAIELAQILHETTGGRFRGEYNFDPSTVLDQTSPLLWATHLLPNYAAATFPARGVEFGYRPTRHLRGDWFLLAPLGAHVPYHDDDADVHLYAGISLERKFHSSLISAIHAGPEVFMLSDNEFPRGDPIAAISLVAYALGEKVRVSTRYVPSGTGSLYNHRRWNMSAGLYDLNGTVFWLLRQIGNCRSC